MLICGDEFIVVSASPTQSKVAFQMGLFQSRVYSFSDGILPVLYREPLDSAVQHSDLHNFPHQAFGGCAEWNWPVDSLFFQLLLPHVHSAGPTSRRSRFRPLHNARRHN